MLTEETEVRSRPLLGRGSTRVFLATGLAAGSLAGRLTITWTVSAGRHRIVIGRGSGPAVRGEHPGVRMKVTPTRAGRRILRSAHKVKVTIVAVFTPTGAAPVTDTTNFLLQQ
jgi:hypothetical protein